MSDQPRHDPHELGDTLFVLGVDGPAMGIIWSWRLARHSVEDAVAARWRELRERDDGSISVEKAVVTAIALALALGLMAAIRAVVIKYQNQIS